MHAPDGERGGKREYQEYRGGYRDAGETAADLGRLLAIKGHDQRHHAEHQAHHCARHQQDPVE